MKTNLLAQTLSALRREQNLTQEQLGNAVGVSARTVSRWENGAATPDAEACFQLTRLFHVSLDELLHGLSRDAESGVSTETERNHTSMLSIRDIYKIGRGPSSSHTIGPERICLYFRAKNPTADRFRVVLFGSLARTGKGHRTDYIVEKTLEPIPTEVVWDYSEETRHPNTMELYAYQNDVLLDSCTAFSIGGGDIQIQGLPEEKASRIYPIHTFRELADLCAEQRIRIWQYVEQIEGREIWDYLRQVWNTMKTCVRIGLDTEGVLPGGLNVIRKAHSLQEMIHIDESPQTYENRMVSAYAFAVAEQNAAGGTVVTAPTCGASGVLPAVLYYEQVRRGFSDEQILRALATAGMIGNLIKTNSSVSGAECGCQAEIGSACSMAAAALGELLHLSISQIEYAAEIAIEHHLGLTCDPICGLVQIPCIERNAVAAMRAINAVSLANFLTDSRKISFDLIVKTMYETGRDLSQRYRETSEGGLAKLYS